MVSDYSRCDSWQQTSLMSSAKVSEMGFPSTIENRKSRLFLPVGGPMTGKRGDFAGQYRVVGQDIPKKIQGCGFIFKYWTRKKKRWYGEAYICKQIYRSIPCHERGLEKGHGGSA